MAGRADASVDGSADALLAGSTGLVGRALTAAWAGPGVLHLLVRRPMPAPRPHTRVHVIDFAALPALPAAATAFCTLGTTIKTAGSPEAFREVDFDAVLAFARAAHAAGVRRFAVVSALGADAASRNFYSRVKGEMEQALDGVGFERLIIARPSLLAGDRDSLGQPTRPAERLALAVTAPLARWLPRAWRPIGADTVARALLRAVADAAPGRTVLGSARLQELGA